MANKGNPLLGGRDPSPIPDLNFHHDRGVADSENLSVDSPLVSKKVQSHHQRKMRALHMVNNRALQIGFASNFTAPVTVE